MNYFGDDEKGSQFDHSTVNRKMFWRIGKEEGERKKLTERDREKEVERERKKLKGREEG